MKAEGVKYIDRETKKILIVSRSFYPENSPRSFRTTELVKEFARKGHEVTLFTLKKDEFHVPLEDELGVIIKDLGPLRFPKVVSFGKSKVIQSMIKATKRGLQLFFEYPDIELMFRVKKVLKHEKGYDLLISIAVPHSIHWGVAWARKENHRIADVWAADCGDPYMGFDMGRISKPFYFKYLEKMFCRKADFITVPVKRAKEAYYEEFRHKIEVIPQGFKFDEDLIHQQNNRSNNTPLFGYAGNLWGGGRNPDELLEFLVNLDQNFRFVIYTKKTAPVAPYLNKANGRIEIRDYIPRKELLNELSKMDFLVNLENESTTQVPSKLIDYYLTGRPVLSVPSSGMDSDVVGQFLEGNYSEKVVFNGMDRYRIENVCDKFLALGNTDG